MQVLQRCLLVFLFFYTLMAQPGLPSCWLQKTACEVHSHPSGMPAVPHSHDHLLTDVQASGTALPVLLIPVALLLELLRQVSLGWKLLQQDQFTHVWLALPDLPPPR